MSKAPFFADADAISRTDSGKREVLVFAFYLGLIVIATIVLAVGDHNDLALIKLSAAAWLIGLPLVIMVWISKAVDTYADELLKKEYYGAAARSCGSVVILVLIWILWGRWFDSIFMGGPAGDRNTVGNLVITVAPYMTILTIYITVRKKMIALSKETS